MLVQQPDNVVMQPLAGHVPGQPIHMIGDLSIGEIVQQRLARLVRSFARRQEQRCLVLVVLGISIGVMHQQNVDRLRVVNGRRPVERRLAGIVRRIDVRIGGDQILDHALDGESSGQD